MGSEGAALPAGHKTTFLKMLLSDSEGGSYLQISKQRTSRFTIKLKKIKAYTTEGCDGHVVL